MWACDPTLTSTIVESYKVAGPVFAQSLQAFLAAQCAIAGDHLWPADATEAVIKDPNYDFIVVGAGSAGAVVANRLSEVPGWKVLLIEAGGDPDLATETPQLFYNSLNTATDWGYKPEPQENACRGYKNNRCAWPRGKVLGGSSSINAMFYIRGNKLDYDEWAALGNKGWSYEDILPYFKKSENYSEELTEQIRKYHGTKGYLSVENDPNIQDLEKLMLQAVSEVGLNIVSDVNGATQMGAAKSSSNIKDGVRHSTARAFLSPIKDRNNLHVMKNAYVTKVVFKPNTNVVNGVVITKNGQQINVNAEKEVILSAGTINTAQLLLLSGIGPSKHLRDIGIQVKADLPVGENLQDHPFVPMFFNLKADTTFTSLENITKEFVSYVLTRKGPYSHFGPHRVVSFHNTTDPNALSPDIQFHYLILPPGESDLINIFGKHGIKEDILNQYQELNNGNFTLTIYVALLQPRSKGKILLKYKDPNQYPLIYANYFKEPKDVETIIKGIKQHIFKLAECETFKALGIKLEFLDIDECKHCEKNSDDFLECYAKVMTFSLYHPTGTAKMGPLHDNSAVVDPELKVRNVERLRVIDASIMPKIVRGNTNAPVIMIGEKGADLIKKAWRIAHTDL